MTTTRILYLLLSLLFFAPVTAKVDRSIRFSHFTNSNGLPSNTVFSICQDHKGFIWIATKSGLCKYDGRNVTTYEIEIEKGIKISGNQVRQVYEDNQQRLWVLSQRAINLYDREKDTFILVGPEDLSRFRQMLYQASNDTIYIAGTRLLKYNEEEKEIELYKQQNGEIIGSTITSITEDKHGRLWLGKLLTGIMCIDTKTGNIENYKSNPLNDGSLISDKIKVLYTDKEGNVWIGTKDKGICYYNTQTSSFMRIQDFPDICVLAFAEDVDGNLWIGSEDGLYIYYPQTGKFTNYKQNYNEKFSLNDNAIYSIFRDREGNMLLGTYFGGVNIYSSSYKQFYYYDYGYSDKFLSGKAVRQITGNGDGNLWIATEDGGLNYYDHSTEKFTYFKPQKNENSISYHNVHSLLLDSKNNLWVGTYLGGLNKYDLKNRKFTHYTTARYPELIIDNIFSLLEDRDGEIWIGTTAGLAIYNPATGLFKRFHQDIITNKAVDYLLEDSDGDIWIATRTHGVFQYIKSTEELINHSYQSSPDRIPDNYINYIYEDRNKNIWIATHEDGLCRYDKANNSFRVFTKEDGLPSNTIFGIIESNSGNLWISTNNGLSCMNAENKTISNYSVSEGLPNKEFNYNSVYKDKKGMLYFGTINGMISFYPEQLHSNPDIAHVELMGFSILGKPMHPGNEDSPLLSNIQEVKSISLNYQQSKSFSLDFTVPTISHPNSTFYAIRFDSDKQWSYLGTQNHVTYINLPSGEYILHIKAAFNNKWTGDEPVKTIKIIIRPPFWKSTLAYLIYVLFVAILIFLLYLFIKKRQQEKNLILAERIEKEKIQEINALKLNFFTKISHELRTPLSLILLPLQSLLDKKAFKPEIQPKIKLVTENASRMNNLIEELMLFTKIETKQEKIRVKKGHLLEFIRSISDRFRILAEDKDLKYTIDIKNSEKEVWFAPVKVEKIVYNLLSNAFKYTSQGGVKIKAQYEEEKGFTYLKMIVSDTGMGISAEEKENIFENYYQVNDFIKSQKTGFGIGLTLVRELVLLHRGSIDVSSELNKGSDFIVRLNISVEAFNPDEISDKDADGQFMDDYKFLSVEKLISDEVYSDVEKEISDKQYKLLIVEDNAELVNIYDELFRDTYSVISAINGKDGYEKVLKHQPDIIISDVMMPEMNGFELVHKIKSRIETSHIPVILLTAKTGSASQLEGLQYGADLYVEKPFHPTILIKQISNLIATKENLRKLYAANKIELADIKTDEKDKKLIESIERFIIKNLDNEALSLNDIMKEIGIGRTLLHLKLKSIVGLSTTEFINNVRLKESLKFLQEGKNVSEAAYACGFSSPNYYSRCFKKFFGMPPNEYIQGKKDNQ
ncbi:hybrid sensor histidine kinase/response regulator transcription factor [Bacteroides sp. 519]|uniref:hybrid sensor histidine kinase/response regulator transcription factor n=1 Tax=Bacteroides sp. 519 TaxID=2302937 RepID=UPI0013D78B02|nr:hybrid sensor histidine kinase/response regulator transcription factor [Bacteroides sp. 519]NDV58310.1 hybrid sensor histidine kinase/response regulator [Bacteroides sp. 519]